MDHDFEDVAIKINAPELLEIALRRKRNPCMISTGSMSDPYLPLENNEQLTRKCLEIIEHYGFGLTIQTKSDLILRDLELLKKINERAKCVVQITLTTYDEALCQILEPNVCTTKRRFEVLKILAENHIPTIVWLCPILPFINDTEENITGIVNYCLDAQVKGILSFGMSVTLRDGDRQYFYQKLDEHFPGLKQRYIQTYGNSYSCTSPNNTRLNNLLKSLCQKHDLMYLPEEIFTYLHTFEKKNKNEQLSFAEQL